MIDEGDSKQPRDEARLLSIDVAQSRTVRPEQARHRKELSDRSKWDRAIESEEASALVVASAAGCMSRSRSRVVGKKLLCGPGRTWIAIKDVSFV